MLLKLPKLNQRFFSHVMHIAHFSVFFYYNSTDRKHSCPRCEKKVNCCAGETPLCLRWAITRLPEQVKEHVCLSALYDITPITVKTLKVSRQVTGISHWVGLSYVSGDCGAQKLTRSIDKTAVVIMANVDQFHSRVDLVTRFLLFRLSVEVWQRWVF